MIFEIKMDGIFAQKARFVAGGHTTYPPSSITHSSVVLREIFRITFMRAALNDLQISSCDIEKKHI